MRVFLSAAAGTAAAEGAANVAVLVMLRNELERHGVAVEVSKAGANFCADAVKEATENRGNEHEESTTTMLLEAEAAQAKRADAAIRIVSQLQGSGFEAYHQITNDWACYEASVKLAQLMQHQVQRYRRVYNRPPRAGVESGWLKRIRTPAVVCETYLNGETDILALLPDLRTQAKAYARAILMYLGVMYEEPQYRLAKAAKMPETVVVSDEPVLEF